MLPSAKLHSYIGFAIKSGHVVWGADAVLRARGVHLIVADDSINRTSKGDLERLSSARSIPLVWADGELLEGCTHKNNCKCIGVTDVNLAQAALQQLTRQGEENE